MTKAMPLVAVVLLLVPAVVLGAQTLKVWDFEQGLGEWQTMDSSAEVTLVVGEGVAAEGSGALVLSYARATTAQELGTRGMPGSLMAALAGPLPGQVGCLEFAAKATTLTPVIVGIGEEDGSRYEAVVAITPGAWHEVKVYLADMRPSENSEDENGVLDPDQVANVSLVDLSVFLALMAGQDEGAPIKLPKPVPGQNELSLDNVRLTDEVREGEYGPLQDGASPLLRAMFVLGAGGAIEREAEGLDGGPCWHVRAEVGEREVAALLWPVPPGYFNDAIGVDLLLRSEESLTMILQVKEADASEYNLPAPIEAGRTINHKVLWSDFRLGDDSADENGQLDTDQIVDVVLVDATGVVGGRAHTLDLRLGRLGAMR